MDAIRKQLDVLMGANRNGDVTEVDRKYYDRDVCRLFLSGLCPHDLFQLTVRNSFSLLHCFSVTFSPIEYLFLLSTRAYSNSWFAFHQVKLCPGFTSFLMLILSTDCSIKHLIHVN
nr:putative RNA-binding protein Luc7-like 2 isoform X1 [Ipomoea batatas]GME04880.1 putative RNA-binding protein Luc7-like 2 isoform X1 [Ipomoea batatas]